MHKPVLLLLVTALGLSPGIVFGLDVGERAPDFVGSSTQGEIRLSDYLGKKNVVLALYFAAFTPV